MALWQITLFELASAVCLISAFVPRKTREANTPKYIFSALAILSATVFALLPFVLEGRTHLVNSMFNVAMSVLPSLWIIFSIVFARGNYHKHLANSKLWVFSVIVVSILFGIVTQSYPSITNTGRDDGVIVVTGIGKWLAVFVLLSASMSIVNVERTFRSSSGIYRRRLAIPFLLAILYSTSIILGASNLIISDAMSSVYVLVPAVLATGLFPSIANYIRTYQIQKSGVFLKRQAVYSSVAIILIGIYLVFVGAVGRGLDMLGADTGVFYSILAAFLVIVLFLVLLLSGSVKRRIKKFVDTTVYSGSPADYQDDLAGFSEEIATTLDVSNLVDKLSDLIRTTLGVHTIWLYVKHPHMPSLTRVYPRDGDESGQIDFETHFVDWIFRHGEAIELSDLKSRFEQIEEKLPQGLPPEDEVAICTPLIAKHELVGILFVGNRDNRKSFRHDDIQFISAVSNQFALAVLSASLSEQLLAARQIESFNKFSTFIMHDLKNSISMLSMLIQNYEANRGDPDFQKSAFSTIQGAVGRMQNIISKLRASELDETPAISDCHAHEIVLSLKRKLAFDTIEGIELREQIEPVPPIRADSGKLLIILENLVVNAIEAMPQGGMLTIEVGQDNEDVVITISDTGVGMEREFINKRLFTPFETTKKKGLGIGLYQSRDHLERMGGRFRVNSKLGEGTTFSVIIPASKNVRG